ncbi:hypothetical protein QPK32_07335 [Massilia sp. YIM B02763]|uniref:hypothetical protein n=1 Tax=Massilia sp. YIM B02763 TaxID=3050130 RepID=UPI0025B666D5|nr:hypothetical protein [Massilia sp. YIM B02763]MDN4052885.1 hypothetical protein [Massilia sp. YIM B02763]
MDMHEDEHDYSISLVSRHSDPREIAELQAFSDELVKRDLHHIVKEAFYDSNSCCCTFEFNYDLKPFDKDAEEVLEVANQTIAQFVWFGTVKHGGPMRDIEFG